VNAPFSPAVVLDLLRKERDRRAAHKSLIEFTRQSFHIIEPGQEFVDNWHLHVIAEHLQAVTTGDVRNLVINIPPGCMKSILASVAWPAWEWAHDPTLRVMGASYGADLAIRDAAKTRDIVASEWYRERWPAVQIKLGSDQKTKYELTAGGWRMATSVGGRATGEHPDRKIVDDPHNAKQAESDAEREAALTWFDRTLSTRGQSRGASTVVVMQRLHERDVTGHILADLTGYTHLCIPMEWDGVRRKTFLGAYDPRKRKGELLWPEMFNDTSVTELKQLLGSYGASGQLQQDPAPAEGGILKTRHFRLWPSAKSLPQFEYVLQSYDTAFSEKTTNDPTGCEVWGVFTHDGERHAMLLDAWDEHLSYPELRQRVIRDWSCEYGGTTGAQRGPATRAVRPARILVEAKASGQSLLQDLRLARVPAVGYNPGTADKVSRAHQAAPTLELGVLWVPESGKNPGQPVSWAAGFMRQLEKFPTAEHDEYVDCFTQAIIYLKNDGWFELPRAAEREEPLLRAPRTERTNPYAA
jgi:predicted phage terminase large subunit-like protein